MLNKHNSQCEILQERDGDTPLHSALKNPKSREAVETMAVMLLKAGANAKAPGQVCDVVMQVQGMKPIKLRPCPCMHSARYGAVQDRTLQLSMHCVYGQDGWRPLDLAASLGLVALAALMCSGIPPHTAEGNLLDAAQQRAQSAVQAAREAVQAAREAEQAARGAAQAARRQAAQLQRELDALKAARAQHAGEP